jgi:hypothetical protein
MIDQFKENLNNQLRSERTARKLLLGRIKKFVGDSIEGLKGFETQAEPAEDADYSVQEEDLAVLETLGRSPDGPP